MKGFTKSNYYYYYYSLQQSHYVRFTKYISFLKYLLLLGHLKSFNNNAIVSLELVYLHIMQ